MQQDQAEMSMSYDKNGFKIEQKSNQKAEKERFQRWQAILPQLNVLVSSHYQGDKRLINAVRAGISDPLRSKVWPAIIKQSNGSFDEMRNRSVSIRDIDLDMERTFPQHKDAKNIGIRMKAVLNALAVSIQGLGYCQGMNFVIGTLLLRLNDQDAFKVAYHIFHWQQQKILMNNLDYLHQKMYTLDRLTRRFYPKLHSHLKKYDIEPLIYASSWFITLFCNCMPACINFRILECYLLEGEKIIYRAALQILKMKKKSIKSLTAGDKIVRQLKNFDQFNELNVDFFMQQMFELSLSRDDIQDHIADYRKQHAK